MTENKKTKKEDQKKKGVKYFLIGAAFLIISIIMYSAGIDGGIIYALISLGWVIFILLGIGFLVSSLFSKK